MRCTFHVIHPSHSLLLLLFSLSVACDSLRPHRLLHTRLTCPSPIPRACSNSHPLTQWCHPTISSSVIPFSSHPQSFPASGAFHPIRCYQASQVGQAWRICLPMQETQVSSLGWGNPSGKGTGNPLQFSGLGNPMDRGAWWAMVHGVAKSQTRLKQLRKHTLGYYKKLISGRGP